MASGCGEGYCTNCPRGPTCLISCPRDMYLSEDGTCGACQDQCSSCIRQSDCNLCSDVLCSICPKWDTCEECSDNAHLYGDSCRCNDNFFQTESACVECHPYCKECTDTTEISCSKCRIGYYKQHDIDTCLSDCPTGFLKRTENCLPASVQDTVFTFDAIRYDWESHPVYATGGSNPGNIREDDDPIPSFQRGIFFNNGASLNLSGLMINHAFALSFWTKPQYGYLITVSSETVWASMHVSGEILTIQSL